MHSSLKYALTIGIALLTVGASLQTAEAVENAVPNSFLPPEGENSVTNPTTNQQENDTQDSEITRKIRQALTDNDSLSPYAQNIKIITKKGEVLLKGSVLTVAEKRIAEAVAASIAGAAHVKSKLEVTGYNCPRYESRGNRGPCRR